MTTVNIVGAGAVGQTLGHLWAKQGTVTIQAVVNASLASAERAVQFIGQGQIYSSVLDLPAADVTILTVPDRQIAQSAADLARNPNLQPGAIVLHCSGALSSECLAVLRERYCVVASLHPMLSFKHPQFAATQFVNTPCALEGDPATVMPLTRLFQMIGGSVYCLAPEQKALYHAAAVLVGNYPVVLAQHAHACLLTAGLPESQIKAVIVRLLQSVVDNIYQVSEPKLALTGPIQRGDASSLNQHLEALADSNVDNLYRILAKETLALTVHKDELRDEIERLLK